MTGIKHYIQPGNDSEREELKILLSTKKSLTVRRAEDEPFSVGKQYPCWSIPLTLQEFGTWSPPFDDHDVLVEAEVESWIHDKQHCKEGGIWNGCWGQPLRWTSVCSFHTNVLEKKWKQPTNNILMNRTKIGMNKEGYIANNLLINTSSLKFLHYSPGANTRQRYIIFV